MLRTVFLLVLVFCFSFEGLAQAGQPLKEVTHDSTLTGSGKEDSPLGVADGALTSSKLATDNTPQSGQVLAYSGFGLTWQTPANAAVGPLRVVDADGNEVGVWSGGTIRHIPSLDLWIMFQTSKAGVTPFGGNFTTFHESIDCTGEPFSLVNPSLLPSPLFVGATRVGDDMYVNSGPEQMKFIQSAKNWATNNCSILPIPPGTAVPVIPFVTFPVSDLGTPPFRLSR